MPNMSTKSTISRMPILTLAAVLLMSAHSGAPDRAFVTVAVEAHATSPRDAQRQNADAMAEVLKRLTDARVPKDSIRTLGYGLDQEFDFIQGRRVARGFAAR